MKHLTVCRFRVARRIEVRSCFRSHRPTTHLDRAQRRRKIDRRQSPALEYSSQAGTKARCGEFHAAQQPVVRRV